MDKNVKVVAIVVTYNRKKLLEECINSILNQSYAVDKIIIIDNNSTDNTKEYLIEKGLMNNSMIKYKQLDKNIGGAGGFYEGFKESYSYAPDFLWIMDDDTIPNENALKELVLAAQIIKEDFSYLASSVYGPNGEFMNVPKINLEKSESGYQNWYKYLADGMIKIKEATFVSLLINYKAVLKIGYPMKNYFIWGDDVEYTLRLNKFYGKSYMVGKSIVIHKRKIAKTLKIYDEENINRINFYYYMVRNNLINKKEYYGEFACLGFMIYQLIQATYALIKPKSKYRFKKFIIVNKAIWAFIFKKYDSKAFKDRLDINVTYKNI